jgi:predicted dehydrogenase
MFCVRLYHVGLLMDQQEIQYNFEYDRKLRVAFIGAGGHSFRNVYPTFQYAPVDLVAICDRDSHRASAYARQFGAAAHYTDHQKMLRDEKPEAVFIVTAYEPDGRVQATQLALDVLEAGAHVWMEKPTAATLREVRTLTEASRRTGRQVMTGLKKIFTPAFERLHRIVRSEAFGGPASICVRYPQNMPPIEQRTDRRRLIGLLDHIYHPAAIITCLMGRTERMHYEWEPFNGGSVTTMRFTSGAIGTLHLTAGQSGSSPLERVEVIGRGENAVLENGVRLTYYRRGSRGGYGRSPSYLVPEDQAPLSWEPEFSLGQLYNKNLFYLGYVPEVLHFCRSVLDNTPLQKGTLEQVLEIMKLYEAYLATPPGTPVTLNPQEQQT